MVKSNTAKYMVYVTQDDAASDECLGLAIDLKSICKCSGERNQCRIVSGRSLSEVSQLGVPDYSTLLPKVGLYFVEVDQAVA